MASKRQRPGLDTSAAATSKPLRCDEFCHVLQVPAADPKPKAPAIFVPLSTPLSLLNRDASLLSALLHPLTSATFLEDFWRRRPLAIVGVGAARVQRLCAGPMFGLDVRALMENSASDSIFVWMKEQQPTASRPPLIPSLSQQAASPPISSFPFDNPTQLDAALVCYHAGASLYFRSSPALSGLFVPALNAALGYGAWGHHSDGSEKGEIEVFCSRAGHYTPFHTDFQDNFTVQLRGKKTWIFGRQLSAQPLRGWTPHYKDRSTEETQRKVHSLWGTDPKAQGVPEDGDRVTLSAGDVLYHPAGVWHAVQCDEDSVSINVSLVATTYADVVADAIRQRLWETQEGREGVTSAAANDKMGRLLHLVQRWTAQMSQQSLHLIPSQLPQRTTEAVNVCKPRKWRPPPLFCRAPLRRTPPVEKSAAEKESSRIRHFSIDLLWTVVELRSGDSEDDNEEGDEDAREATKEEEKEAGEEKKAEDEEEDEGGEDEDSEADTENRAGEEDEAWEVESLTSFAFHFLFGNEELESARRVQVRVPASYAPIVRAIAGSVERGGDQSRGLPARQEVATDQLMRRWQLQDDEGVQEVLEGLEAFGYLMRMPGK